MNFLSCPMDLHGPGSDLALSVSCPLVPISTTIYHHDHAVALRTLASDELSFPPPLTWTFMGPAPISWCDHMLSVIEDGSNNSLLLSIACPLAPILCIMQFY